MSVQTETEAEKMRRVPGIVFADGPTGRRARITGTGIDVFELISGYLRECLRAGLNIYAMQQDGGA